MSQRILITGAARGIGAETARRLAARGHRLALLGLEPELLEEVAAAAGDAHHAEVDVTDRDALDDAVEGAAAQLGGLDAVIANAGIGSGGMFASVDPDEWERVIAVNLVGVRRTLAAALPHVTASRGYLLPVASAAAVVHAPMMSAYAAAKAGVEAMANSLRVEVAHRGVGVGVAYFSWIDTEMVSGAAARPAFSHMRDRLRGPFGRTYPAGDAAEALVRGVETRARIVAAPGWVRWMIPARALMQRVGERDALAQMPEVERLWDAEVAAHGAVEASRPIGAGGEAARR
jgi:NAD(P)-dependent dehydrogenase (short-subunit alcohol dehydrogenase family)